jgi:nicotinamidase-related amidase
MQHPNTLILTQAALTVIDMQEAFRTKISDFSEVAERIATMVKAADLLQLPVVVTEQYPKGLGHSAPEILEALPATIEVIEKTSFSSCGAQPFQSQLKRSWAKQVIVCGIEAHICVNQTVHDLLASGYQVHLLTDCITSRKQSNKEIAIRKMELSGAIPSSLELALFEMLQDAKHEQFKAIQGLIK